MLAPVAAATTISGIRRTTNTAQPSGTPARRSRPASQRRENASTASDARPITEAGCRLPETCCNKPVASADQSPAAPSSASKLRNWLTTINIAAPETKPWITGRLSSCDKKPRRSRLPAPNIRPDISARHAASATYSALPGVASGCNTLKVMIAVIATGPTACTIELPTQA